MKLKVHLELVNLQHYFRNLGVLHFSDIYVQHFLVHIQVSIVNMQRDMK